MPHSSNLADLLYMDGSLNSNAYFFQLELELVMSCNPSSFD